MQKELLINLATLRLVIGFLGEKDQYHWWSSSFLNDTTKKMLEFTFPRTASLAQYEGVSAAAARVHDEMIGVGETFHLFRLPELIEKSLVNYVQTNTEESDLKTAIHSKENALEALTTLAGSASISEEGPVNIGGINDNDWQLSINKIASSYLTAFTNDKKAFPYLRAD